MNALTYTYTRQHFAEVMKSVNKDHVPVVVTSQRGKPESLKHQITYCPERTAQTKKLLSLPTLPTMPVFMNTYQALAVLLV